MRKPLPLSRNLVEEHWLVGKVNGECISGFSEWHMVRTLALSTPILLPGVRPEVPALPLSYIPAPCGRLKIQMDSSGVKGQSRNFGFPPGGPTVTPQRPHLQ